jgi:kynurenine formamidase
MTSRRNLIGAVLAPLLAPLGAIVPKARAQAIAAGPVERDDDVDRILSSLSNWGRWGADDQRGTLNFLTPEMRLEALRSVRSGRVVPLAREWPVADARGLRRHTYQMMRYTDPQPDEAGSIDEIGMIYHGYVVTHLDALCHLFTPEGREGMYNGFPIEAVTERGAEKLGVEVMGATGIVGRGVLLDVAALKGGPLPLGSVIMPADLEAAEARQGVEVGEGDLVFVRNGQGARNSFERSTGLHASCLPWLHARRVALLSGDGDNDVHPALPGFARWSEPVHMIAIPYMGMPLLCAADLEALSAACAEEGRWEFLAVVAPWRLKGATSSPVNPLAIFCSGRSARRSRSGT